MARKITALKAQKRNPNRISVFLDGEYAFGLARLVGGWLKVGQSLSNEKIESLQHQDTIENAYQKAIRYLSYRSRSEQEVIKRLVKYGFDGQVISEAIDRLKTNRIINDEDFARNWVENRSTFRPRGHRLLVMELRQKGVEVEAIQAAIKHAEDEETLALQAAKKYVYRLSGLEWNDFRKRLSSYLGRKGFYYGTIKPTVKSVWSEFCGEKNTVPSTKSEEIDYE